MSEELIARQRKILEPFKRKVTIRTIDILKYKERCEHHGYILLLEVLDNFPHDKLLFKKGQFFEAIIDSTQQSTICENVRPLTDPVIIDFLTTLCKFYNIDPSCLSSTQGYSEREKLWYLLQYPLPSFDKNSKKSYYVLNLHLQRARMKHFAFRMRSIFQGYIRSQPWRQLFIPTVIFQLFKHVRDYFPNHHFIIADFHYLPDSVAGINAPTVQRTNNNVIVVERTYLTPKLGENDIFFPINFDQLQVIFKALNPTKNLPNECVVSTKRFMRTHAEFSNTCTILRYNPLLEDFTNTSFFLSQGL